MMGHPSSAASLAFQLSATYDSLYQNYGNHHHEGDQSATNIIDLEEFLKRDKSRGNMSTGVLNQNFYDIGNYSPVELEISKPWKTDPTYFQNVYISSLALTKMAIHADSGGDIEVMGMMIGKIVDRGMVIMDSYSLPVVGTETRVNAQSESYEYMVSFLDSLKKLGYRKENIIGWYHSHPGYGCWLSGIDVATESLNQTYQDPYLAVVIDPKMTKTNGKVEIGAFRTYPERNVGVGENNKAKGNTPDIPDSKLQDFGAHSSKYYSLNVEIFKSQYEDSVLGLLLDNYWISGLTGLPDEDDTNDVDANSLSKSEKSTCSRISALLNQFDETYTKVVSKITDTDYRADLAVNGNMIREDRPNILTLKLPKSEKIQQVKCQAQRYDKQTDSLDCADDDIDGEYSDSDEDDMDFEEDGDDGLQESTDTDLLNSEITIKGESKKPYLADVKMKDADEEDEENEEDYGSVGSDTSVDNASTFSSSSAVNNANNNSAPYKYFSKSSNSYLQKVNSNSPSPVATTSMLANSPTASSVNTKNKTLRQLEQKLHKRKELLDYFAFKNSLDKKKQETNSTAKDELLRKKMAAARPKYASILAEFEKDAAKIANEELRKSLSLKLQQELFF